MEVLLCPNAARSIVKKKALRFAKVDVELLFRTNFVRELPQVQTAQ